MAHPRPFRVRTGVAARERDDCGLGLVHSFISGRLNSPEFARVSTRSPFVALGPRLFRPYLDGRTVSDVSTPVLLSPPFPNPAEGIAARRMMTPQRNADGVAGILKGSHASKVAVWHATCFMHRTRKNQSGNVIVISRHPAAEKDRSYRFGRASHPIDVIANCVRLGKGSTVHQPGQSPCPSSQFRDPDSRTSKITGCRRIGQSNRYKYTVHLYTMDELSDPQLGVISRPEDVRYDHWCSPPAPAPASSPVLHRRKRPPNTFWSATDTPQS